MPFNVQVPVVSTAQQQVTPELKLIVMDFGDAGTNGRLTILLGVKDASGNWRTDVQIDPLRLEDDPDNPIPARRNVATLLHRIILSGKIDGASPLAQRFGIPDGTPMQQAIPQIAWSLKNA